MAVLYFSDNLGLQKFTCSCKVLPCAHFLDLFIAAKASIEDSNSQLEFSLNASFELEGLKKGINVKSSIT